MVGDGGDGGRCRRGVVVGEGAVIDHDDSATGELGQHRPLVVADAAAGRYVAGGHDDDHLRAGLARDPHQSVRADGGVAGSHGNDAHPCAAQQFERRRIGRRFDDHDVAGHEQ
ncbi:MAG: hypothetical protein AUG49_01270 [Catenulispora sp. 13_1_20CM_3_70_7]|nr:MAG: hypothetical protein AUG49_01270 [Catenulispora sp. 13_1_20CM_3_70_7]